MSVCSGHELANALYKRHTKILPRAGKLEPHIVSTGDTIGETVVCGMLLC